MKLVTPEMVYRAAKQILNGEIPVGATHGSPLHKQPLAWTKRIHILGLPVSVITYDEWLDVIGQWMKNEPERVHHVCTINPEFMMVAQKDINFRNILTL
jgi:UDP-N-acetyl-D-mannosaminuronic acid transferase (WecB/TagA/CpsF family)